MTTTPSRDTTSFDMISRDKWCTTWWSIFVHFLRLKCFYTDATSKHVLSRCEQKNPDRMNRYTASPCMYSKWKTTCRAMYKMYKRWFLNHKGYKQVEQKGGKYRKTAVQSCNMNTVLTKRNFSIILIFINFPTIGWKKNHTFVVKECVSVQCSKNMGRWMWWHTCAHINKNRK